MGGIAEYDAVTTEFIGNSFEGRNMTVLKFCQGECGDNPIMWIDAGGNKKGLNCVRTA